MGDTHTPVLGYAQSCARIVRRWWSRPRVSKSKATPAAGEPCVAHPGGGVWMEGMSRQQAGCSCGLDSSGGDRLILMRVWGECWVGQFKLDIGDGHQRFLK